MIVRILMMLLALVVIVNLFITAGCFITGENLYKKYGRHITIGVSLFAILVAAMYLAIVFFSFRV